jgi:hypothetical protein
MTRRKRWSTPRVTHEPVAWEVSSVLAGKGTLIVKMPRIRNRKGQLLAEGPRDEDGRLLATGGRPPIFDDAAKKAELIAKLRPFILRRQAELGRRPPRDDKMVLRFARNLVAWLDPKPSDDTIIRQLIDPVLQELRPKRSKQNF